MKKVKKYTKILLGCLLIAITLNVFFKKTNLIPSGMFGFAILYSSTFNLSLELTILLENIFFFTLAYIFMNYKDLRRLLTSFISIPIFVFLTKDISSIIDLHEVDELLISIYGGVLMGIGFKLIYKEQDYISGSDVIAKITKAINVNRRNLVNYIIDGIWIIIAVFKFSFEGAMYSLISIGIMEYLSKRAALGTSDSKVFYIITKKEREVRDYIIDELGYELTIFDVKGGFLKTKNKVLMSVIPTSDYYKLKEGVKYIDPKAFISITDSYEVINQKRNAKIKN